MDTNHDGDYRIVPAGDMDIVLQSIGADGRQVQERPVCAIVDEPIYTGDEVIVWFTGETFRVILASTYNSMTPAQQQVDPFTRVNFCDIEMPPQVFVAQILNADVTLNGDPPVGRALSKLRGPSAATAHAAAPAPAPAPAPAAHAAAVQGRVASMIGRRQEAIPVRPRGFFEELIGGLFQRPEAQLVGFVSRMAGHAVGAVVAQCSSRAAASGSPYYGAGAHGRGPGGPGGGGAGGGGAGGGSDMSTSGMISNLRKSRRNMKRKRLTRRTKRHRNTA